MDFANCLNFLAKYCSNFSQVCDHGLLKLICICLGHPNNTVRVLHSHCSESADFCYYLPIYVQTLKAWGRCWSVKKATTNDVILCSVTVLSSDQLAAAVRLFFHSLYQLGKLHKLNILGVIMICDTANYTQFMCSWVILYAAGSSYMQVVHQFQPLKKKQKHIKWYSNIYLKHDRVYLWSFI